MVWNYNLHPTLIIYINILLVNSFVSCDDNTNADRRGGVEVERSPRMREIGV